MTGSVGSRRRILAVVPARGGSKAIPRKNLEVIAGRSLIAHAADVISRLPFVDLAVLTTDDAEIASEGTACGLAIVNRPPELATDDARGVDAWRHAWLAAEEMAGHQFEMSLLVQPTSPLRTADDLKRCLAVIEDEGRDAVITVSPTPAHFSPDKTLLLSEEGDLQPYLESGVVWLRQKAASYYFLNGYGYMARRRRLVEEEKILGPNTGAVVIDRPVVNIDEPFDLELAAWVYEYQLRHE